MYFCYILHSAILDRFYVGSTSLEATDRLDNHVMKYYGTLKFTAKAEDWILYYSFECSSYNQARKIEHHIKQKKSKKYIRNLELYPEMALKLLDMFHDS
jgi:putative endonuclease